MQVKLLFLWRSCFNPVCFISPTWLCGSCSRWKTWELGLGGSVFNPISFCLHHTFCFVCFYAEEPFSLYSDQTSYLSICLEEHSQLQVEHFSQEELKKKVLTWPVCFLDCPCLFSSWSQRCVVLTLPSWPPSLSFIASWLLMCPSHLYAHLYVFKESFEKLSDTGIWSSIAFALGLAIAGPGVGVLGWAWVPCDVFCGVCCSIPFGVLTLALSYAVLQVLQMWQPRTVNFFVSLVLHYKTASPTPQGFYREWLAKAHRSYCFIKDNLYDWHC